MYYFQFKNKLELSRSNWRVSHISFGFSIKLLILNYNDDDEFHELRFFLHFHTLNIVSMISTFRNVGYSITRPVLIFFLSDATWYQRIYISLLTVGIFSSGYTLSNRINMRCNRKMGIYLLIDKFSATRYTSNNAKYNTSRIYAFQWQR